MNIVDALQVLFKRDHRAQRVSRHFWHDGSTFHLVVCTMILGQLVDGQAHVTVSGYWVMKYFECDFRHRVHVFAPTPEEVQPDVKLNFVLQTVGDINIKAITLI